jgi:hypothetical protein
VTNRLLFRCAALVAAYAVALQAMFSAFAPPARDTSDAASLICRSGIAGEPAQPAAHDTCLACLAGHCAGAASPHRLAVAEPWPMAGAPVGTTFRIAALPPAPSRDGAHSPRAPPPV